MKPLITGLHHVTALATDPQKNVDFYAGLLGTRLVKKTINFDAPDVYHLYYGDEMGRPGTILTFFPFGDDMPKGRIGKGQLSATAFSIPENSIGFWTERLKKFNIKYKEPQDRFNETYISFEDHDGLGLELVASANDNRPGFTYGQVPENQAIKGFHSVTLNEDSYEKTAGLLNFMNHNFLEEKGNRFRYSATGNVGDIVDIVCEPNALRGLGGAGTVHHLAFATENDESIKEMREKIATRGLNVTQIIDRQYFHSIYFREPGGILFEVATSDIGFDYDETKANLGESIKLPKWQEQNRESIQKNLLPISLDWKKFI